MKTQSRYTLEDLYKIKQVKREIQYLQKQLSEIDSEIKRREQDKTNSEPNKKTNYFQEWLDRNDDSKTDEPVEEDKEKLWGNYILVILLMVYFVVMSLI
ncbi:hypothetical protein [Calothrix sp. CCY 0018]|uniref:hypothetical protein n=1 Tax=Calothrix sp. CCY 0018 TaxID=3103864 RepID=UPI0039C64C99